MSTVYAEASYHFNHAAELIAEYGWYNGCGDAKGPYCILEAIAVSAGFYNSYGEHPEWCDVIRKMPEATQILLDVLGDYEAFKADRLYHKYDTERGLMREFIYHWNDGNAHITKHRIPSPETKEDVIAVLLICADRATEMARMEADRRVERESVEA